jgi:glucose-6-phosphate dehydrogenase assembly protein OpcA
VAPDLDGRPNPGDVMHSGTASGPLSAHSVAEVQDRLSELWARAAAARLEAARADEAAIQAQAEAAARAAAALAASQAGDSEGRHVAARSSVLNLVVIAGDRATSEKCARIISGTAGRHPSRSLLISEVDPDAPSGLEAEIDTIALTSAGHRTETGAEMIHVAARGEAGRHLASIIVPLLVHDLPVAIWWPGQPALGSHRSDRLLPIADRLIVDGSEWAGNGLDLLLQLARIADNRRPGGRVGGQRPLVVVDFALVRQSRWREALASVYDLPDLRPHLGAVRSIDVTYAAAVEGDPELTTNVVRPLYHVAWLASRLGMTVVESLGRVRAGHRAAMLRQRDHQVSVSLKPAMSILGAGSTVRVELTSRLRGSEMTGILTAGDCTVDVVIMDHGNERVRRTYNAPRLDEVALLTRAVQEGGTDPLALGILDMAKRILVSSPKPVASAGEDFGTRVGEPWSAGGTAGHRHRGKGPHGRRT